MVKPNIFVVGPSGTGKSSSLRNLNPERTVIFNIERKLLPFRNAAKFTRQVMIKDYETYRYYMYGGEMIQNNKKISMDSALDNPNTDVIIIESFTTLTEYIYAWCKKKYRGFDVWDAYATEIYDVIYRTKDSDKYIIFTGVDEVTQDEENKMYRDIKVEGKKMKGNIAKEFVMVLATKVNQDADGKPVYQFLTNTDGIYPAKSPADMLPYLMENDLDKVLKLVGEYYGS